jgi:hypothetical protein
MTFRRLAGISGIVFVVMVVINIILSGEPPALDDPTADVASYYQEDEDSLRVAAIFNQMAGVFVAIFAAGLLAMIGLVERGTGRAWAIVGLIGIVTAFAAFDASSAASQTLLINTDSLADGPLTRGLFDLSTIPFVQASFNIGVFALGVGAGILTTRVLPAWLGWIALVAAAAGIVSGLSHGDRDSLSSLGMVGILAQGLILVFSIIAGVLMLRDRTPEPAIA